MSSPLHHLSSVPSRTPNDCTDLLRTSRCMKAMSSTRSTGNRPWPLLGQLEIRFLTQSISCCDAFTCTFLRARLQPPKGGEQYAKMPRSIVPPLSLIAPPLPASDDGGTLISLIMRGWKRLPSVDRFVWQPRPHPWCTAMYPTRRLYRVAASLRKPYSRSGKHRNVRLQRPRSLLQSPCIHQRAHIEVEKTNGHLHGPRTNEPSSKNFCWPRQTGPVTLASNSMERSRHREKPNLRQRWLAAGEL